jgi:outer membrane protein assembly factor BamA
VTCGDSLYNSPVGPRAVSFLISIVVLIASASAQSGGKAQLNYKLLSIHVKGLTHFREEEIIRASGLAPGHTVTEKDFQHAVQTLGDTGLFTDLSYGYHYTTAGCDLELQVSENDKLVPILFDNFVWFSDDDLISQLHSRVALFEGKLPLRGGLADQVAVALNSILGEHKIAGHADYMESAALNGPMDSYVFQVKFHPVVVRNMDFPGAATAEIPALQTAARNLANQEYLRSVMRPHERLDLLPVYLSRGYLKAHFSESGAKVVEDGPRTVVDVSFPVVPGIQYRVSRVQWTGESAFPAEKLQGLIHLKNGEPPNAVQLQTDLESVQKLYGTKGYLMASASAHPNIDDSSAAVAYELNVVEGEVFRMGELQVDGIEAKAVSELAAQWQIKKGEVYDDSYLGRFFQVMYHDIGVSRSYSVVPKQTVNQQEKTVTVALHFVPKR